MQFTPIVICNAVKQYCANDAILILTSPPTDIDISHKQNFFAYFKQQQQIVKHSTLI